MTSFTLEREPTDPIATSRPVTWAIERLRAFLDARGVGAELVERASADATGGSSIIVAGPDSGVAAALLSVASVSVPAVPESFAILPGAREPTDTLVCGRDARGLVYALLELADRVEHAEDAGRALPRQAVVEKPANAVRSVTRLFCSELEDKSWFYDESFWDRYLSMLVTQRFNRFSLTLGLGYNYPRDVTDAYLYFAYPFLLSVPGYDVRVPQLSDDERDRNLATIRSISEKAEARALDFQLGLWTHAFEWIDSPRALHTIEGLTSDRHGDYCRDAVHLLLESCPGIRGLTFRIHGESGIPERSWDFWRTVFDGVATAGRTVGLDLHAKGLDERTLRSALDTGQPVTVSPKFWAEHMGLPYHQAAIRERERLEREDPSALGGWHRAMTVSEGSRPFTRYGYADFLREDRDYDVVFRLWAGTQRLLLWGDPAMAAGYGRSAHVAGTQGLEWCEPLTFKGREGSGVAGSRTGYADGSLVPADDWEKYAYTYRLFGRLTYDPDAAPTSWRRDLRTSFGPAAPDAEAALASASRILPLVTTVHHPSASNNYYWPEIYTDMPIAWSEDGVRPHPYLDTPEPRRFGMVSPLDPEVFSSVAEFVGEARAGEPTGRISPLEVAARLDLLSRDAGRHTAALRRFHLGPGPDLRRWITDAAILAALGGFFAGKLRAAVWYELHRTTGNQEAIGLALDAYRAARASWLEASSTATGVYAEDLTFGPQPRIRGHWADRLPAIEADLEDMEDGLGAAAPAGTDDAAEIRRLLDAATPLPADLLVLHVPPRTFVPGEPIDVVVRLGGASAADIDGVTMRYRPMNHALAASAKTMERSEDGFIGSIPTGSIDPAFPLAYGFVLRATRGRAWRHPGIGVDLSSQPYFVVGRDRV